jgi:Zn-dependent protease with chaperone function
MKRLLNILAMATSTAALVACATAMDAVQTINPIGFSESGKDGPKLVTSEPTVYSTDSEGARLNQDLENKGELTQLVLEMPYTESQLNTMLAGIAANWPHPLPDQPRVKISMLNEYSGVTYANGTIVIGLGTFSPVLETAGAAAAAQGPTVQSDQELQYLMAHEFSHYALGHHNKGDSLAGMQSFASKLTGLYNTAAVLQEMRYQETADGGTFVVQDQSEVSQNVESAINTFDLISALSARGLAPAWNRNQEDEADVLALDLIKAEGINAPYYEAMFTSLYEQETLTAALTTALQESVSSMQQQALQPASLQQAMSGNAGNVGTSLLDGAKKQFMTTAREKFYSYVTRTHRSPKTRLAGVQSYELAAYPDVTEESRDTAAFMEEPSTVVLDAIKSTDEFMDAKAATIAYYESIGHREDRNYVAAEQAIQQAMNTRFGQQAAIQFEAGRVAEYAGNPQLARLRYQAAIKTVPLPDGYRRLARLEVRSGNYGEAESVIQRGETVLMDTEYFLPSRINLAVARDDVDLAMTHVRTCRDTQRADLIAACEANHAGLDPADLTAEERAFFERQGELGNNPAEGLVEGLGGLFKPKTP